MKYVKVITGYKEEDTHFVPMDESHKAYFLFLNPGKRGVFKDGLALSGAEIKKVVPDYSECFSREEVVFYDELLSSAVAIAQRGDTEQLSKGLRKVHQEVALAWTAPKALE